MNVKDQHPQIAKSVEQAKNAIINSDDFMLVDAQDTYPDDDGADAGLYDASDCVRYVTINEFERRLKELNENTEFDGDKIRADDVLMVSDNFSTVHRIDIV